MDTFSRLEILAVISALPLKYIFMQMNTVNLTNKKVWSMTFLCSSINHDYTLGNVTLNELEKY